MNMSKSSDTREFLVDIYVYANKIDNFVIGAYDMLCDGGRVEARVVKFKKTNHELSCVYIATLHKAFLRAADHIGKYAIPIIDPDMTLLVPHGKKLAGRKSVNAKFVFRFHIVDSRAAAMARCDGVISYSPTEEKWKNLFKLLAMSIARTKTPYKNLRVKTKMEVVDTKLEEVADIAEYADIELKYMVDSYKKKNDK